MADENAKVMGCLALIVFACLVYGLGFFIMVLLGGVKPDG